MDDDFISKSKKEIKEFENHIKDNYQNNNNIEGYLINLSSYKKFRNKIFNYNTDNNNNLKELNEIKNTKLKPIEFKTSKYLMNMLFNGNAYIIINKLIWNIFGELTNTEAKILYSIENNNIIFNLDDNIQLKFNCSAQDNIIDINNISSDKNNFEKNYKDIEKLYKQAFDYYKFEKDIEIKLNNNEKEYDNGFLIEETWIKKWMEKINYKEIKEIFQKSENEKEYKDKIIYLNESNKIIPYDSDEIIVKNFKNKNDIYNFLKRNSLTLVPHTFLNNFKYKGLNNIPYTITKNNFEFQIGLDKINIKSTNNIISLNSNNIIQNNPDLLYIHLKILLNFYYFNKEIISKINSNYDREINLGNQIYYIKKEFIDNYKNFFEYSLLSKFLETSNSLLNEINCFNLESNYNKIFQIILSNLKEYINKLNSKISSYGLTPNDDNYILNYKEYKPEGNSIYSLDNFEIINYDIILLYEKLGIIKKEKIIKGEYISGDKRIFFSYIKDNKKYFQIDFYDHINNRFITEYILKDIFGTYSYFKEKGINYMLNKLKNNQIIYEGNLICYCYNIKEINSVIENDDKYLYNIVSFLLAYNLFKKNVLDKIQESTNQPFFQTKKYYLVNKKSISEFLDIFADIKLDEIILKYKIINSLDLNKNIINSILQDKRIFPSILNKKEEFKKIYQTMNIFNINNLSKIVDQDTFSYPDNLMFLDEDTLLIIVNLLEISNSSFNKNKSEIFLNFNNGNIILMKSNLSDKNGLIYIYSLDKKSLDKINFILEIILSLPSCSDTLNTFNNILKIDILESCINNPKEIEQKYGIKIHLINEKYIKNDVNILDKNIILVYKLYKEYINLNSEIGSSINNNHQKQNYYLISNNYINHKKNLLHYNDIIEYINNNNQIFNEFYSRKDFYLKEIKNYLSNLNKNNINLPGNNNNENYKLEKYFYDHNINTSLYYYKNTTIINESIKNLLNNFINKDNQILIMPIECSFDNKKIFIKFKELITIGYLDDKDELIFENLIYPGNSTHLDAIYQKIKQQGYQIIQKYLLLNKIEFEHIGNPNLGFSYKVKADIYNIENNKNENIKKIILLYLELKKNGLIGNKFNNNLEEYIYLINSEILTEEIFNEIDSLFENNQEIKNSLISIYDLNLNGIENIITKLDKAKLNVLYNKYSNYKFKQIIPKAQNIELKNKKKIKIYRKFIMLKKNIFDIIYNIFDPNNLPKVYYINIKNEEDLIIDEKKGIITLGKISEDNYFNVNYILIFDKKEYLEKEINDINMYGIKAYLNNKTIFKKDDIDDYISPIFSIKEIIGYCYKMSPGIVSFNNKKDFSKNLTNQNLLKVFTLYKYYSLFIKKMNDNSNYEEEYYLVKKTTMADIKKLFYYEEIKSLLDKINPNDIINKNNQQKISLYILKNLSEEALENFVETKKDIDKLKKDLIEADIVPVYDNNNKENSIAVIYNNFELIESYCLCNFIEGINFIELSDKNNQLFNCILKDGKIIIKYPYNFCKNNKDIIIIGTLDKDNTFINEYIIIYKNKESAESHLSYLEQYDLNNYLNNLKLINNSCKMISGNNNKEIGQIIKLDESSYTGKIIDIKPINPKTIKEFFKNPPLIGLDNIGATCYMNATLQCLCNILKFVDYFKYNKHLIEKYKEDKKKSTLFSSFKLLIEELWPNDIKKNIKSIAPKDFKKKISEMNPLFEGIAANDAKDLVQFLIMTLHSELNKAKNNNIVNTIINNDQRNKNLMFQIFCKDFTTGNISIISDLFYAVNYNITQCGNRNCNIQSYNFQTYFFLVFPLEEVRIFKTQNNFNNNEVNIYDCFYYDQRINYLTGQNNMYCNYCRQTCPSSMRTILYTGPQILIIILNRGKGIQYNVKINFFEEINLENFIELKNTGFKYELIGVITHLGESGMGGHFIAYCLNPINEKWYQYNDSIVNPVNDFKKDVIDYVMPYLLFYQKI